VLFLGVCDLCAHECLFFGMCIFFEYVVHVISSFKLKFEREENKFQLFLCLSLEIPAKSVVEFIRKECVDEGSIV
jgi:hypothetical protein